MPSDEDYADMAACRQKVVAKCTICNKEFYGRAAVDDHIQTEEHKQNILKKGIVIY